MPIPYGESPSHSSTENFSELEYHVKSIKEENKIYSATGKGKVPWISCDDIAAVGYHCLITPEPPNTDMLILGPQLLTYNEVCFITPFHPTSRVNWDTGQLADIFTESLGRTIVHQNLTQEQLQKRHQRNGMPEDWAGFLAMLDTGIASGDEDRKNAIVLSVTGDEPRKFVEFVEDGKAAWQ